MPNAITRYYAKIHREISCTPTALFYNNFTLANDNFAMSTDRSSAVARAALLEVGRLREELTRARSCAGGSPGFSETFTSSTTNNKKLLTTTTKGSTSSSASLFASSERRERALAFDLAALKREAASEITLAHERESRAIAALKIAEHARSACASAGDAASRDGRRAAEAARAALRGLEAALGGVGVGHLPGISRLIGGIEESLVLIDNASVNWVTNTRMNTTNNNNGGDDDETLMTQNTDKNNTLRGNTTGTTTTTTGSRRGGNGSGNGKHPPPPGAAARAFGVEALSAACGDLSRDNARLRASLASAQRALRDSEAKAAEAAGHETAAKQLSIALETARGTAASLEAQLAAESASSAATRVLLRGSAGTVAALADARSAGLRHIDAMGASRTADSVAAVADSVATRAALNASEEALKRATHAATLSHPQQRSSGVSSTSITSTISRRLVEKRKSPTNTNTASSSPYQQQLSSHQSSTTTGSPVTIVRRQANNNTTISPAKAEAPPIRRGIIAETRAVPAVAVAHTSPPPPPQRRRHLSPKSTSPNSTPEQNFDEDNVNSPVSLKGLVVLADESAAISSPEMSHSSNASPQTQSTFNTVPQLRALHFQLGGIDTALAAAARAVVDARAAVVHQQQEHRKSPSRNVTYPTSTSHILSGLSGDSLDRSHDSAPIPYASPRIKAPPHSGSDSAPFRPIVSAIPMKEMQEKGQIPTKEMQEKGHRLRSPPQSKTSLRTATATTTSSSSFSSSSAAAAAPDTNAAAISLLAAARRAGAVARAATIAEPSAIAAAASALADSYLSNSRSRAALGMSVSSPPPPARTPVRRSIGGMAASSPPSSAPRTLSLKSKQMMMTSSSSSPLNESGVSEVSLMVRDAVDKATRGALSKW